MEQLIDWAKDGPKINVKLFFMAVESSKTEKQASFKFSHFTYN
jgi:hypothetical protein